MKRKLIVFFCAAILIVAAASQCSAASTVRIAASIGEQHQMSVSLNKVENGTWTPVADLTGLGMDFGFLQIGADSILRSDIYFAMDVPVLSNKATWSVTHTRTNFAKDASNNLNTNVNVTFVKVNNADSSETVLSSGHVSYANSNNKVYTNTDLANSRLRIYYGIANGDSNDAPGTTVITSSKPAGIYTGTVTLTLSP